MQSFGGAKDRVLGRNDAFRELLKTEKSYVDGLEVIVEVQKQKYRLTISRLI